MWTTNLWKDSTSARGRRPPVRLGSQPKVAIRPGMVPAKGLVNDKAVVPQLLQQDHCMQDPSWQCSTACPRSAFGVRSTFPISTCSSGWASNPWSANLLLVLSHRCPSPPRHRWTGMCCYKNCDQQVASPCSSLEQPLAMLCPLTALQLTKNWGCPSPGEPGFRPCLPSWP